MADSGPCVATVTTLLDRLEGQSCPRPTPQPTPPTSYDPQTCTDEDRQTAARLLTEAFEQRLQTTASEGVEPVGEDRAMLQQTQATGQPGYANTYQVTGEAHRGSVTIDGPDDDGDMQIRAELHPDP